VTAVAAALALAALAQSGEPAPPRRSLLVITLDTTRRDVMGFHGRTPSPTPNLDRLAARSIVFEDAYTVAPLTLPAHTSLFTGLFPRSHGVHENSAFKVPQSAQMLAEVLKEQGYATGAAVGAFVLDRMFGIDQGFERYDVPDVGRAGSALITERRATAVIDRAVADLAELATGSTSSTRTSRTSRPTCR
jgi:choline-sulfatase